jgi:hypothetical protein
MRLRLSPSRGRGPEMRDGAVLLPRAMRRLRLPAAAAIALSLAPGLLAQALPETRAFLEEVRRNLRSDHALLEDYTFSEEFTERRLDGDGAVKKTKTRLYEVYPSLQPGRMYRKLVEEDGRPLRAEELAAQDREYEAKIARQEAPADREAAEKEQLRKEQEIVADLYAMDEFTVTGRAWIDGRPAIVVEFHPKPDYEPVTRAGRVLRKVAGRAWIDEDDKQLVRLEGHLLESLGVGPVRVVRLQKGAQVFFQRRKVNGEIWLPAEARFEGRARILLVFGGRVEISSRYGDYRKFSVGTETAVRQ